MLHNMISSIAPEKKIPRQRLIVQMDDDIWAKGGREPFNLPSRTILGFRPIPRQAAFALGLMGLRKHQRASIVALRHMQPKLVGELASMPQFWQGQYGMLRKV
jgi:hypothetical protein